MGGKRTVNVVGIVNFSMTTPNTPSSSASSPPMLISPVRVRPCTTTYFASRSSKALILPGSLINVAEKRSFWQDGSRGVSMSVMTGPLTSGARRRCRNAGESASG